MISFAVVRLRDRRGVVLQRWRVRSVAPLKKQKMSPTLSALCVVYWRVGPSGSGDRTFQKPTTKRLWRPALFLEPSSLSSANVSNASVNDGWTRRWRTEQNDSDLSIHTQYSTCSLYPSCSLPSLASGHFHTGASVFYALGGTFKPPHSPESLEQRHWKNKNVAQCFNMIPILWTNPVDAVRFHEVWPQSPKRRLSIIKLICCMCDMSPLKVSHESNSIQIVPNR